MSTGPWKEETLAMFAKRIEAQLRQGKNSDTIERLICRLLTKGAPQIQAGLLIKWVEWRYGKGTNENQTVSIVFDGPRAERGDGEPKFTVQ